MLLKYHKNIVKIGLEKVHQLLHVADTCWKSEESMLRLNNLFQRDILWEGAVGTHRVDSSEQKTISPEISFGFLQNFFLYFFRNLFLISEYFSFRSEKRKNTVDLKAVKLFKINKKNIEKELLSITTKKMNIY